MTKFRLKAFRPLSKTASLVTLMALLNAPQSYAAVAVEASGHAALVGEYQNPIPAAGNIYEAFRVPLGLKLSVHPTENFSVFLGLEYAYGSYPSAPSLLGTNGTYGVSPSNSAQITQIPVQSAQKTPLSSWQQTNLPLVSQAYFSYESPVGFIRAGRMPRHWGLGMWLNAQWNPFVNAISTSDAISYAQDFDSWDVAVYLEKYGEGIGGTSRNADATAYSIEARLKIDPSDAPSSGISRQVGMAFSKFQQAQSNTDLNLIDLYALVYYEKIMGGFEVFYPSGQTSSPYFTAMGGAPVCSVASMSQTENQQTCRQAIINSLAALVKYKMIIGGSESFSVIEMEKANIEKGTKQREMSHATGLLAGFASGDPNQFNPSANATGSKNITGVAMNPNIMPSLLMFNPLNPPVAGMPNGQVTNSFFARVDYTFEHPSFGAITPAVIAGGLAKTNPNFKSNCGGTASLVPDYSASTNIMCVGGSPSLGMEFDAQYRYTTTDRVTFGLDAGYWSFAQAWQVKNRSVPTGTYGVRASITTVF